MGDTLVFGLGFGSMLLVPMAAAFCAACCGRRRASQPLPTSEDDEEIGSSAPLRNEQNFAYPFSRGRDEAYAIGRSASATGLTKVYFRESDWCSRVRKPIVIELPLEGVRSVQVQQRLLCDATTGSREMLRFVPIGSGTHALTRNDCTRWPAMYEARLAQRTLLRRSGHPAFDAP
eukprot:6212891-Pleurochrysis_carterae.AAC.2